MNARILSAAILAGGIALLLSGCGGSSPTVAVAPTETPIPPTLTPIPPAETPAPPTPTAVPPTETLVPAISKPGATLAGRILMGGGKSGQITLKVSADGQAIESVGIAFTSLKCEGFSAGSTSTTVGGRFPVLGDKFELKSSSIGEISGRFTSPTAAEGAIHLALFDGTVECGTWDWSAKGD